MDTNTVQCGVLMIQYKGTQKKSQGEENKSKVIIIIKLNLIFSTTNNYNTFIPSSLLVMFYYLGFWNVN